MGDDKRDSQAGLDSVNMVFELQGPTQGAGSGSRFTVTKNRIPGQASKGLSTMSDSRVKQTIQE